LFHSPTILGVAPVPQVLAVETHFDISMAPNGLTDTHRKRIVGLATKNGLPVMVVDSGRMDSGALISYGPNFADMWRRAATYVDTITVADSNAFMADLRGAAYAAKHDPKIIAELKELSRRLARAGETVMHPVQKDTSSTAVRCRSIPFSPDWYVGGSVFDAGTC
jgi:hypothetical protein